MTLEPFIPARCWMAPEMPIAKYSFGRHHLTGLPNLEIGWARNRHHKPLGSLHRGPEGIRERFQHRLKAFFERTNPRDHDLRFGKLGPLALHLVELDELDLARSRAHWRHGDRFEGGGPRRSVARPRTRSDGC